MSAEGQDADDEPTTPVTIEVLDVTMLAGRGRLIGTASVELVIGGIAITLQGVRIVRRPDGLASVEPPCVRHVDGDLIPAVVLPEELEDAIAREVLLRAGARVVVAVM